MYSYNNIDIYNPINYSDPINDKLLCWLKVIPHVYGGLYAYSLTKDLRGTFVGMGVEDWVRSPYRVGNYGAWDIDGTDNYITLPFLVNPNTRFTASIWVYFKSVAEIPSAGNSRQIIQQEDGSGTGRAWLYFKRQGATDIRLASFIGGTERLGTTNLYTTVVGWNHYAVAYLNSTLYLYINGRQDSSFNPVTPESCVGAMRIGQSKSAGVECLAGYVDDVRISSVLFPRETMYRVYEESLLEYRNSLRRITPQYSIPTITPPIASSFTPRVISF